MSEGCGRRSVLVTGGRGFIGRAVLGALRDAGVDAVGVSRVAECNDGSIASGPSLGPAADWRALLQGRDVVIHAAARVHVMRERAADPLAEFRRVNVQGTLALARQAAEVGVRRLVFLSSIKVNGEETSPGRSFHADDVPAPTDAYGISKAEAEAALLDLAAGSGLEVVIIRPPLVYGLGVKGNFASMARWIERGLPLPLGAVSENRRTLVSLDNLISLIRVCMDHPSAANQIFLAGDGEDMSTADLLRRLGAAIGIPARLVPFPSWCLIAAAAISGRRNALRRLCGSLQVDISKADRVLDWRPPVSVDEGLKRVVGGK